MATVNVPSTPSAIGSRREAYKVASSTLRLPVPLSREIRRRPPGSREVAPAGFFRESSSRTNDRALGQPGSVSSISQNHGLRYYQRWLSGYIKYSLVVLMPISLAVISFEFDPITIFVLDIMAIIPLAALLGFVAEDLALTAGQLIPRRDFPRREHQDALEGSPNVVQILLLRIYRVIKESYLFTIRTAGELFLLIVGTIIYGVRYFFSGYIIIYLFKYLFKGYIKVQRGAVLVLGGYFSIPLFFVTAGIVAGALKLDCITVFVLNTLAIISLAVPQSILTQNIALGNGKVFGGFLNATCGNIVELIISLIALTKGKVHSVHARMLGNILSQNLLVLGMIFLCGGFKYYEQDFSKVFAKYGIPSFMAVANSYYLILAFVYSSLSRKESPAPLPEEVIDKISHASSIVLIILYIFCLFFIRTHELREDYGREGLGSIQEELISEDHRNSARGPVHNATACGVILLVLIVPATVCGLYLVGSVDSLVVKLKIRMDFFEFILLPMVGNIPKLITVVVMAMRNEMNFAIAISVKSSTQISLLIMPSLVIFSWIIQKPMSLYFRDFEMLVTFLSVYVAGKVVQGCRTFYIEGGFLLGMYAIIATSIFMSIDPVRRINPFPPVS